MKIIGILFSILMISVLGVTATSTLDVNNAYALIPAVGFTVLNVTGVIKRPAGALFFDLTNYTVPNIEEDDIEENMGGFTTTGYLALHPWIATHPTLPDVDTATTPAEAVTLNGNYALQAGEYFIEVVVPPKTSQMKPESQGESGSKSFANTGQIFVPGTSKAERMGLMRILNNAKGILILIDHEGNRVQLGDEKHPLEFKPVGDSGVAPADKNGFVVEFMTDSFAPGWVYNGTIALSAETLPAVS